MFGRLLERLRMGRPAPAPMKRRDDSVEESLLPVVRRHLVEESDVALMAQLDVTLCHLQSFKGDLHALAHRQLEDHGNANGVERHARQIAEDCRWRIVFDTGTIALLDDFNEVVMSVAANNHLPLTFA